MALIVQKFGGSSVADSEAIKRVAQRVVDTHEDGNEVVVVVSAMGDTTDELLDLADKIAKLKPGRELDILLTAGERISMALLSLAINDLGVRARSFTGQQAGLFTDTTHGRASILNVNASRIERAVRQKREIAIVAGFQGVNEYNDVTTLGRGGSDTTAVALAAALGADVCEIYSDVDGVFTADPRIVKSAHKLDILTFEETLELAAHGTKILHLRAVEYARRFNVPLHVRSSFSYKEGTWIVDDATRNRLRGGNEEPMVTGLAHDKSQAKITIRGVPNRVGVAAELFALVAGADISIDMIVQNQPLQAETSTASISFTLPQENLHEGLRVIEGAKDHFGFNSIETDERVGIVSLVGAGMRSHPGVTAKFFKAIADAGVNIGMISTSEVRISVVVPEDQVPVALKAAHTTFGLDSDEEAIVYGGTGR